MLPKVKICCISSIDEANMAIRYGAAALGLVGKMPGGPGVIDDALIKQIARTAPATHCYFFIDKRNQIRKHYRSL